MNLVELQRLLSTLWEVWFVILFLGILVAVLRPGKRQYWQQCGDIPLQDDVAPQPRTRSV